MCVCVRAGIYIYIYVHTHTHIPFWRIIWQNPKVFKEKQYYQELRVLILSNCSIWYIPAQETGQEETTANVKIKAEVLTMADRVLCDNLPPPLLQPPDSWTCQAQSLWGHVEGCDIYSLTFVVVIWYHPSTCPSEDMWKEGMVAILTL